VTAIEISVQKIFHTL